MKDILSFLKPSAISNKLQLIYNIHKQILGQYKVLKSLWIFIEPIIININMEKGEKDENFAF